MLTCFNFFGISPKMQQFSFSIFQGYFAHGISTFQISYKFISSNKFEIQVQQNPSLQLRYLNIAWSQSEMCLREVPFTYQLTEEDLLTVFRRFGDVIDFQAVAVQLGEGEGSVKIKLKIKSKIQSRIQY